MKSRISKVKATAISALLFTTTILAADIKPVIAGCGSGPVQAWTIDAVSGQRTSLGQGEHTICGNKDGSFEVVALPGLRFGWANCISNCVEGATPNLTTVQLNGKHKPGNVAKFSGYMVCVSQTEKPLLYCWK